MAKKIGVEEEHDQEIDELTKDVHPEKVMDVMEKIEERKNNS